MIAERVQERDTRFEIQFELLAIDVEGDGDRSGTKGLLDTEISHFLNPSGNGAHRYRSGSDDNGAQALQERAAANFGVA
jgi:hypothetical protein